MANFNIKSQTANTEQLIYLRQKIQGRSFKYSLGNMMKVHPNHWDSTNQKYLAPTKDFKQKNTFLKNLNSKFETICNDIKAEKRAICFDSLREELDKVLQVERKVKSKDATKSFFDYWKDWENYLSQRRDIETVRKKGYTKTKLQQFSKETGYKIGFDTINRTFATHFMEWAFSLKNKKGEYSFKTDNTVKKYLSITKEFMKWCTEEEINFCLDFNKIKDLNEEYFGVFALSKEDIHVLMNLNFNSLSNEQIEKLKTTQKKLDYARDAFVFRSLCGIRFSDFENLSESNFVNDKINLITVKTGESIFFKLHPIAISIVKKYNYNIPCLGNAVENTILKHVAKIAGFYEEIVVVRKRKGDKIYDKKKRWELVTTHVARKTFITNCLNAGMQQHVVMKLAGILKPATLLRYIQVTDQDIAREGEKFHNYI